ncbi:MAG: PTS sugar transporter subunit IIB [Elusimicrobia bacterium]|nr:PTS sugar transporter subunit IIB [Elusimicrobiota bacterium]
MAVELVRIDDRLVHGQVVEGWIPFLRADAVVVASQAAAADPTQVALMQLALPDAIALAVLSPRDAAAHLASPDCAQRRVLVLVPAPAEALALLDAGFPLKQLNVGGLHYSAGRVQLGRVIFLSDEDRQALRTLAQRGVLLEGRAVPTDRKLDLAGLLA